MTNYAAETYIAREPESVDACRFDGTHAHAEWFADQDSDAIAIQVSLGDRARGVDDRTPARMSIMNPGEAPQIAKEGDWVLNTDDGRWEVLSDAEFHSGWEALG